MDTPVETTPPPPLAETLALASARFGIRFLARLLDLIYVYVIAILSGIFTGILCMILSKLGKIPANWLELIKASHWHTYLFALLGYSLYYVFSEGLGGTTVGKLVCGLRVVQTDGRPGTLTAAFKRAVVYHWDGFFFGVVAYTAMEASPWQQRYGDRWADAVVVRRTAFKSAAPPPTWKIPVGILVGSAFYGICQITAMLLKVL